MGVIANLLVKLGADTSNLTSGLSKSQSAVAAFGKGVGHVSTAAVKAFGVASLAVIAATAAMTKSIIDVGSTFEATMSGIGAVSGLDKTSDQMKQLTDLALEMGAKTSFSANEAAQGIEELIKAGLTTEQVLGGGLAGALDLAAAGGVSVAEAAEIASTALNAFKADSLSVAAAADILAGAANASATDVGGLRLGLSMVSAVASGMGMTFKDTATALAIMAQNGLKGSDAGTSLKTMLMNLQPVTDKQVSLFKKLNLLTDKGTSLFYDEKGSLKSLAQISGILNKSMKNLTDQERSLALETLFGSDAIRAGNILFKEGAEGVEAMAGAMDKVTAAEVAAARLDNFKGAVEGLTGSLQTIGIVLYRTFQEPLKQITKSLTEGINALGASGIMDVASEMFSGLFGIFTGETGAEQKFQANLTKLLNSGISSIVKSLPKFIAMGGSIVNSLITAFSENDDEIGNGIVLLIEALADSIVVNGPKLLESGLKILSRVIDGVTDNLPKLVPLAVEILVKLADFIADNLPKLTDCAIEIIEALVDELTKEETLHSLLSSGYRIVVALVQAIIKALPQIVMGGIEIVAAIANDIAAHPEDIVQAGLDLARSLIVGFAQGIIGIHDAIEAAIKGEKIPVPKVSVPAGLGHAIDIETGANIPTQPMPYVPKISNEEWAQYGMSGYATGTSYVPQTGPYILHRGEEVVPAAQNQPEARSDSPALIENNQLMKRLISLVENQQPAEVTLDGKSVGEATFPWMVKTGIRLGTPITVRAR